MRAWLLDFDMELGSATLTLKLALVNHLASIFRKLKAGGQAETCSQSYNELLSVSSGIFDKSRRDLIWSIRALVIKKCFNFIPKLVCMVDFKALSTWQHRRVWIQGSSQGAPPKRTLQLYLTSICMELFGNSYTVRDIRIKQTTLTHYVRV